MHGAQLKKVHDRRSNDTLAAGQYASIEIQDPYNPEDKIVVLRQLRGDPLGRLHAHHQIDDAQYHGGRAYQRDWEAAERGARAIDPTKEAVDGGPIREPLTVNQMASRKRLMEVRAVLGRKTAYVIDLVLVAGQTLDQLIPEDRQVWRRQYAHILRCGLEELAIEYGYSTGRIAVQQIR